MSGIVGIINTYSDPEDQRLLAEMSRALLCCNPNIKCFHYNGLHIALNTARLGYFSNEDVEIFVHGSIYSSATQDSVQMDPAKIVSQAYIAHGERFAAYLNGSFVIALWDKRSNRFILSCDRYGSKPIYYYRVKHILLLASEQKAFLKHPYFSRRIDLQALVEYFTFQNFLTDRTLYQNVHLFPAGSYAVIKSCDNKISMRIEQYFDFNFFSDRSLERDYAGCVDEMERLFVQAVRRQIQTASTNAIGAYLSGGVDSGLIVSIASQFVPCVHTYTCGFDLTSAQSAEVKFDERETAEIISAIFKTEHYEMVLKSSDMERVLDRFCWAIEEPRVGQSYPNYCIARLASKFSPVVLSGNGGDELFGGYPWRYYRAMDSASFDQYIDQYYAYWQRLVPEHLMGPLFAPISNILHQVDTREIFRNIFRVQMPKICTPQEYINHSLYFEAKTFMRGLNIIDEKISQANGLEIRAPFLDNDLADFAMCLPVEFKLKNFAETIRINENETGDKKRNYFLRTNDGKRILRSLMRKIFPESITRREKQGFSAPDASWFRNDSADFVREILYNPRAQIYEFLDRATVKQLLDDHFSYKENRRLLIWSFLSFEKWCELFL